MVRVSVLMPVHNGQEHLHLAVASTLRAMDADDELLVFDDGSTDNTENILKGFTDSRLVVFHSDFKTGIAKALNYLLERAKGAYIARMDADDVCLPWRFSHQIRALEKLQTDLVFGAALYFGQGVPFPVHVLGLNTKTFTAALVDWCPGIHPTMLARRRVFELGAKYEIGPQEDLRLWLRLALHDVKMCRDPKPVLLYRQHQRQVSKSNEHLESVANEVSVMQLRDKLKKKIQLDTGKSSQELLDAHTGCAWLLDIERFGRVRLLGNTGLEGRKD